MAYVHSVNRYFVQALLNKLDRERCDPVKLLEECEVGSDFLKNKEARVSIQQYIRLKTSAIQSSRDEMLGYSPRPLPLGSFAMMCKASMVSVTLFDVLETYSEFYDLVDCGFYMKIEEVSGGVRATFYAVEGAALEAPAYIWSMSGLYRFLCWMASAYLPVSKLSFSFAPSAPESDYSDLFVGAQAKFSQEQSFIEFAREQVDLKVNRGLDDMRKLIRNPLSYMLLSEYGDSPWRLKVKKYLNDHITEPFSYERMCEELNCHPQTLRRKLAKEATTFRELKNAYQRDLAIHYLGKRGLRLEDICHRVGFSEISAFSRAFKQWTGSTPDQYRKTIESRNAK